MSLSFQMTTEEEEEKKIKIKLMATKIKEHNNFHNIHVGIHETIEIKVSVPVYD